nr:hypothetical protein [uncultured Mediterranean phage uvMED]
MTNPRKRTRPGSSIPFEWLYYAIRWESTRHAYFSACGLFEEAEKCGALQRVYERRVREESSEKVFQ